MIFKSISCSRSACHDDRKLGIHGQVVIGVLFGNF